MDDNFEGIPPPSGIVWWSFASTTNNRRFDFVPLRIHSPKRSELWIRCGPQTRDTNPLTASFCLNEDDTYGGGEY